MRAKRSEGSGETERGDEEREGAERKTLAHKLEDSKVIDLSELILPAP